MLQLSIVYFVILAQWQNTVSLVLSPWFCVVFVNILELLEHQVINYSCLLEQPWPWVSQWRAFIGCPEPFSLPNYISILWTLSTLSQRARNKTLQFCCFPTRVQKYEGVSTLHFMLWTLSPSSWHPNSLSVYSIDDVFTQIDKYRWCSISTPTNSNENIIYWEQCLK